MIRLPERYRRPVMIAVLIHLAVLAFFLLHLAPTRLGSPPPSAPMQIIHAKAIIKMPAEPVSTQSVKQPVKQAVQEAAKLHAAKAHAKKMLILKRKRLAKLQLQEKIKKAKAIKLKKVKAAKALALKKHAEKLAKAKAKKAAAAKQLLAQQKKLQQEMMQQAMNSEQKVIALAQQKGEIDQYKSQILALVQSNWRIDRVNEKLKCVYSVALAPDGAVLSASLLKSSGDDNLDQSAREAIERSSPLPVPSKPALFSHFRQLVLTLSPQGFVRG